MGNDNPRKNLKNLILAYGNSLDNLSQDLVLVGSIDRASLTRFVINHFPNSGHKVLDRLVLPGYVDNSDLPLIYSGASCFLFPSLYEGFGFPPLEAMDCGIPVIVSDNSSLPEVVGEAGVFIKNPLDPDEIANSIHKVLDDKKLQAKLKIKGLKQVQKFRWDETAAQTLKLYRAAYDE